MAWIFARSAAAYPRKVAKLVLNMLVNRGRL
jgi:hypothetical protein